LSPDLVFNAVDCRHGRGPECWSCSVDVRVSDAPTHDEPWTATAQQVTSHWGLSQHVL